MLDGLANRWFQPLTQVTGFKMVPLEMNRTLIGGVQNRFPTIER